MGARGIDDTVSWWNRTSDADIVLGNVPGFGDDREIEFTVREKFPKRTRTCFRASKCCRWRISTNVFVYFPIAVHSELGRCEVRSVLSMSRDVVDSRETV